MIQQLRVCRQLFASHAPNRNHRTGRISGSTGGVLARKLYLEFLRQVIMRQYRELCRCYRTSKLTGQTMPNLAAEHP